MTERLNSNNTEYRKMVLMNLPAGSNGNTDIESRLVDTVKEGEGGMNGENSMETYTLPFVK